MTTYELKELWYNNGDMTMEEFIEIVRADERAETVQIVIDEFNHRTACLGRASAKMYVINTLNDILNKLKESKNNGKILQSNLHK